ncbi:MAG: FecR domain-containing protein [Kiritimatiellae bacterium]|nr:FecR domain-containing protein [Kiritimatiellia bacterium]
MNRDDFESLLDGCLDGTATAEEQAQVVAAAEAQEELRAVLVRHADVDIVLKAERHDASDFAAEIVSLVTREEESTAFAAGVLDRFEAEERANGRAGTQAAKPAARSRRLAAPRARWGWRITGMAAAALVGVGILLHTALRQLTLGPSPTLIGEVADCGGDVFVAGPHGDIRAGRDHALTAGATLLVKGATSWAKVRHTRGAQLEFIGEARATFQLEKDEPVAPASHRVELDAGILRASVSPGAKKVLIFDTPHARIEVVGTRFTLTVASNATRVDMEKGAVRATCKRDGRSVRLIAGQSAIVADAIGTAGRPGSEPNGPRPPRVRAGLVALYSFDEGAGQIVHDRSGFRKPINLTIRDAEHTVRWLPGGGLQIHAPTIITNALPPAKIIDACMQSHALTVEAWITPRLPPYYEGVARIVTISEHIGSRDFTLAQWGTRYKLRLRTTQTDENADRSPATPAGSVCPRLSHVLFARDKTGRIACYLDGQPVRTGIWQENPPPGTWTETDLFGGDFSNWQRGRRIRLALANELMAAFGEPRPWLGELHLVAIYSRALSASEAAQNFLAGPKPGIETTRR